MYEYICYMGSRCRRQNDWVKYISKTAGREIRGMALYFHTMLVKLSLIVSAKAWKQ